MSGTAKLAALAVMAGVGVGFYAGFSAAEALYATPAAKELMRQRARVLSGVAAGLTAFAVVGVAIVNH